MSVGISGGTGAGPEMTVDARVPDSRRQSLPVYHGENVAIRELYNSPKSSHDMTTGITVIRRIRGCGTNHCPPIRRDIGL